MQMQQETTQPEFAHEPQQSQDPFAGLPEATGNWLRAHPEYMTDPEKNAALQHFHWVATRETGEQHTPKYFERIEHHLGLRRQPPQTNGSQRPVATERTAPVRRQYSGPPISAPISREVPSLSTGRPQSYRAPLTRAEVEIARASGITDAEYQTQKERLLRLQASGVIQ
jgi:hypothetical protein